MAPEIKVDVLVVGGGATGLTAAFVSSALGLSTMLIEKQDHFGGTTSSSGGTMWIPGNHVAKKHNVDDNQQDGRRYLDATIGDPTPESSTQRRDAFLSNGPKMIRFLTDRKFQCTMSKPFIPDYHPGLPGALPAGGRTIHPAVFDTTTLGSWIEKLPQAGKSAAPVHFQDFRILSRPRASVHDTAVVAWMSLKSWLLRLFGSPVSMGSSLVAQLLAMCKTQDGLIMHTSAELLDLITENGIVSGAHINLSQGIAEVRASRGVVLAAAGFARDKRMQEKHLPISRKIDWTLTMLGDDTSRVVEAAVNAGSATALLNELWGIPVMMDPMTGKPTHAIFEMAKPHCIVVDQMGKRLLSEAQPYGDTARSIFEHNKTVPSIPCWLILDDDHRRRYTLGSLGAGTNVAAQDSRLYKADTLQELSSQTGIDKDGILQTVQCWNTMCAAGVDIEFGKGSNEYQRYFGDPKRKSNPTMGAIKRSPFYALPIWPGDAGTKGGLLTDEYARVLRDDASILPGLYAAGNTAASIMGESSIGAGVTLGPAMTFAYIAARHLAAGSQDTKPAEDCSAGDMKKDGAALSPSTV